MIFSDRKPIFYSLFGRVGEFLTYAVKWRNSFYTQKTYNRNGHLSLIDMKNVVAQFRGVYF